MNPFKKNINVKGTTIIELLVASVILMVGFLGIERLKSSLVRQSMVTNASNAVLSEHRAINALVQSIPISEATSIFCPAPHPYYTYQKNNDGSDFCNQSIPAPTPSYNLNRWQNLSTAYFTYTMGDPNRAGMLNPVLTQNNFDALNLPALLNGAACTNCHKAGGSVTVPRDFTNFAALTTTQPPFVALMGLGTPMGRRLLTPQITFPGLRDAQGNQAQHVLNFTSQQTSLNSNDAENYEYNCFPLVPPAEQRIQGRRNHPCPPRPVCPNGGKLDSTCIEINIDSGNSKHSGNTRLDRFYGCWQHIITPATAFCTHGVYRPGSLKIVDQNDRCKNRLNITPRVYNRPTYNGEFRPVHLHYDTWQCWNPLDANSNETQRRWGVNYTLTTTWTDVREPMPRVMVSTGALE